VSDGADRTHGSWRTLARRALMRSGWGRRFVWRMRTRSEVDFWAEWLAGAPGTEQWASDRDARLRGDTEVRDPLLRAELERLAATEISILDVGAGPLTALGYRYPGKTLTIVPVDPLAHEYDRLLLDIGREPPVRTVRVAGEELLARFGPGRFDIAFAVNSLDHSAEPLAIISDMIGVVRPGGVVLLRHKRNEGESARYAGMHQWNFDHVDGRFLLWNDAEEIDVGASLGDRADTTAWLAEDYVVARLVVAG
jgi:SAM-dependent methyltransferase